MSISWATTPPGQGPAVPARPGTDVTPHTLIVTTDPGTGDLTYVIRCPGVTDDCRTYDECGIPGCDSDALTEADNISHGQEHHYNPEAGWLVATDQCLAEIQASMADVDDAAERLRLPGPGHYHVVPTWDSSGEDFDLTEVDDEYCAAFDTFFGPNTTSGEITGVVHRWVERRTRAHREWAYGEVLVAADEGHAGGAAEATSIRFEVWPKTFDLLITPPAAGTTVTLQGDLRRDAALPSLIVRTIS